MVIQKHIKEITPGGEQLVDLRCENCGEIIPANGINQDQRLARCQTCDSLFSIEEMAFEKRRRGFPIFLVPDGTDVLKLPDSLEISTSWLRASRKDKLKFDFIFTTFFSLVSFVAFFAGMLAGSWLFIIFCAFFVVASLILLYMFLGNLVNRTIIRVDEQFLSIRHSPLKFIAWREHKIVKTTVRQLFVREYNSNRTVNNVPQKTFGIYIQTADQKDIRILEDMNRETSLFLEQELEEYLGIPDKQVPGEIGKA